MIDKVFARRYRLTEKIGIGGMAEVYKATDEVLGRTVAVKVMLPHYAADPTFATRFKQEAQAAANLQSPYIVNIYDWGFEAETSGGTYYIVMEYVRGTDLKTAIEQRGKINQRKVAEIGSQVCSALSVAHGYDIIHRDIKPHNIMIQPDGNSKVMDFGIARANNANLTQTGKVLGTAYYVSPEQAQGKPLTTATDIYSLGVCLYEAAVGQVPFDGEDPVSIAVKQVNEVPVAPRKLNPDIDPALEAIILRAMAKDPSKRYTTADEMRTALNEYLTVRPSTGVADPSARTQVMPAGTATARAGAGGAGAGGAGAGAGGAGAVGAGAGGAGAVGAGAGGAGAAGAGAGGATSKGSGMPPKGVAGNMAPIDRTAVIPPLAVSPQTVRRVNASVASASGAARPASGSSAQKVIKNIAIFIAIAAALALIIIAAYNIINPYSEPPVAEQISVPRVIGNTEEDATRALLEANLVVGEVTEAYSDTVPIGCVVRTDPSTAAKVNPGTRVNLVISRGSDKVEMPDLKDKPFAEALAILDGLNLAYSTETKGDANIVEGNVCDQSVAAGIRISPQTRIVVYISTGPDAIPIPVVNGLTAEAASKMLADAGFRAEFATEGVHSPTIPEGSVVSQDKTGVARKGETVTLTLSLGPEQVQKPMVTIPMILGMTLEAASNQLNTVGLIISYTSPPTAGQVVITQNPPSGTSIESGSPIQVTFGLPLP